MGKWTLEGSIVTWLVSGGRGSCRFQFQVQGPCSSLPFSSGDYFWASVPHLQEGKSYFPAGKLNSVKPRARGQHVRGLVSSGLQAFDTFMLNSGALACEEVILIWGHLILGPSSRK